MSGNLKRFSHLLLLMRQRVILQFFHQLQHFRSCMPDAPLYRPVLISEHKSAPLQGEFAHSHMQAGIADPSLPCWKQLVMAAPCEYPACNM